MPQNLTGKQPAKSDVDAVLVRLYLTVLLTSFQLVGDIFSLLGRAWPEWCSKVCQSNIAAYNLLHVGVQRRLTSPSAATPRHCRQCLWSGQD